MVMQCFVCKNLNYLNPNLTFHRFPANVDRRILWLEKLNLNEVVLPKQPLICGQHFAKSDFKVHESSGKTFLKKEAVPIVFKAEIPLHVSFSSTETVTEHNLNETWPSSRELKSGRESSSSTLTASEDDYQSSEETTMHPRLVIHSDESDGGGSLGMAPLHSSTFPLTTVFVESKQTGARLENVMPFRKRHSEDIDPLSLEVIPYQSSSSTLSASEVDLNQSSELIESIVQPPRKRNRCTAGNISSKMETQAKKIKLLQQSVRRLRARVTSLSTLVEVLKEKCLISENAKPTVLCQRCRRSITTI